MDWILLTIASSFFITFHTIITKKILISENEDKMLLYLCFFVSFITLVLFAKRIVLPSFDILKIVILKSFVIFITWTFMYRSYKHMDLSIVIPLRNLSPIILLFLSFFILGEKLSSIQLLGVFILVFGALILDFDFKKPKQILDIFKNKYVVFLFIAMIGNSISAVIDKKILVSIDEISLIFYFYLFTSIMFALKLLIKKEQMLLKSKNSYILVIIASSFIVLADYTYFVAVAMPQTLISLIIPLRRTSNILTALIGGKFFSEKKYLYHSVISVFMLAGVFLITKGL